MESVELLRKKSISDIIEQSSCATCSGSRTDTTVSPARIKQFSVFSSVGEAFGKPLKPVVGDEQQIERMASRTEVESNKHKQEEKKIRSQDNKDKRLKDGESEIKTGVRKLEEASNPFNLEYTTRGNWWEGSLHY